MDPVDAILPGDGEQCVDVQVRADRFTACFRAEREGFVGLEAMEGKAIFVAVNGDGSQSKFGGGAKTPDSDFRSIGGEQFLHGL